MKIDQHKSACLLLFLLLAGSFLQFAQTNDLPVAYIIPIHGEINASRMVFVRRGIQKAEDAGARLIIFDIDTFGGAVDAALQISTLIGSADVEKTIAFVPAAAEGTGVSWSAGALISLACGEIYMAPGTSIGAAAPVFQTQTGMEMAPEKTVSAVRAQMSALAEKNGYPVDMARAMVDSDVELLEVYLGDDLRLTARDSMYDLEREAERLEVKLEEGKIVSASGKLLTLTAGEMARYGVSTGTVSGLAEILAEEGMIDAEMTVLEESPYDRAAGWITGAGVTGLLILAGLVALYMEVTSPGFGIPGTIAIICFAVVFLSSALLGTIGSLELLMFLAGVVLLVVEIFLIPGFGITGISGIILIGISLVLSRQDFIWPEFEWEWDIFRRNLTVVGISIVSSLVVFGVLLKVFPRIPLFNRLILTTPDGAGSDGRNVTPLRGAVGSPVSLSSASGRDTGLTSLVGKHGTVVAALRPVGKASIDGEVWEVQSDGDFLDSGDDVEVIETRGNRLFVRRIGDR
jgi:membrane-bound serine protease (ClpP class)